MRVGKPMLNPDGTECCGNDAHRGYVCQYHEGWLDALDSEEAAVGLLIAALKEIRYDSISGTAYSARIADAALKAWEETVEP